MSAPAPDGGNLGGRQGRRGGGRQGRQAREGRGRGRGVRGPQQAASAFGIDIPVGIKKLMAAGKTVIMTFGDEGIRAVVVESTTEVTFPEGAQPLGAALRAQNEEAAERQFIEKRNSSVARLTFLRASQAVLNQVSQAPTQDGLDAVVATLTAEQRRVVRMTADNFRAYKRAQVEEAGDHAGEEDGGNADE